MKKKEILTALVCLLVTTGLHSQSNKYVFSQLDFSSGLSNNHITCLYKDPRGFMWFGTFSGLNRYDGYQFKVYKHDSKDSHSVADNYIEQIFEGPNNKLWVGLRSGGYNIYDLARDEFDQDFAASLRALSLPDYRLLNIVHARNGFWFVYENEGLFHYLPNGKILPNKHTEGDPASIDSSKIAVAREDGNGNLWILHQNGLLEKIDGLRNKVVYRNRLLQRPPGESSLNWGLGIDGQNDLWIYSSDFIKGVYYYHPGDRTLRHLSQETANGRLNSNEIYNIIQDAQGQVWVGTDHGGINIIDKRDFSVKTVGHVEDDNRSLPDNSITAMYKDPSGIIWLGTSKNGICYYHPSMIRFPQYRHQRFNPASLSYDDINSLIGDPGGDIWIGSNGGGLIRFDRAKNTFHQYLHDPATGNSLSNNIIVSLLLDKEHRLWIGTYFGGLDCYDGKTFTHYRHDDREPGSLSDDRIMCIYEDGDHAIWIGTLAGGMDRFDGKNKFQHYNSSQPDGLRNNYISAITEDAQKNLWVATAYGIDVRQKSTGQFIHYSHESSQLSSNNVISLFKDSRQNIWAGTREGLSLFLPDKQRFLSYRTEDGLPDNTIKSILEDSSGHIWVSTSDGLSRLTPDAHAANRFRFSNYHEQDGLQGREFNEKSGLLTRDGTMLFGGSNGFNMFRPENIANTEIASPLVLTGLEIFNKSVQVGEKVRGRVILDQSLAETGEITLPYNDDIFSIEFASLDFIYNARNKYAYKLDGFNKDWLTTDGKIRKATYTNLDAGEYTFRVKASDGNGEWNNKEASLKIRILPPFWKTPWAYSVYVLLMATLLYLARRMVIRRARMRFALEQERQEAKRMHDMDLMKIRFFTNMSHELRTPLSLILAPVENLLRQNPPPDPKKQYEVIRRNAKRLLHLVNQLLDFRKMEVNELKLQAREGDILKFIRSISYSFVDLAERKNISFSYYCTTESFTTLFDHDKLERILFNLLSNAFKFTPEHGAVGVELYLDSDNRGERLLRLSVKDNGIGIPADRRERIFERFFQADLPNTILNQGSGIGLAITQEFVKMHNGHLSVDSEINKGSCFTVRIPLKEIVLADDGAGEEAETGDGALRIGGDEMAGMDITGRLPADESVEPSETGSRDPSAVKKSVILIVEDNEDFRFYLKDNLRSSYTILEAGDGREGWQKALALHPNLIVSDISMPVMNGIDLCEKIKKDERTRKIPVILLTALAGEGHELESLKTGATDYITKPFNFEVLLSKIRNILENNEMIKRTYQREVNVNPSTLEVASPDVLFLQNLLELVEKNMSNPDLSVGELSVKFHASRSTFYKRLLLLTGKTPIEFIRQIRLKRAAELLEKSQMTISEIAYAVGFNNPKYFTQYFKMEFGMIPSAYRAQQKTKTDGS